MPDLTLSFVIPTYKREAVLIRTIKHVLSLTPGANEILVVDQTDRHEQTTDQELASLDSQNKISWIRLPKPSIPHAMNIGIKVARSQIVLFIDDDIIPSENLIAAHIAAHLQGYRVVAGQVLQPGESPVSINESREFRFCSNQRTTINELMAGNFSIDRTLALSLGGFDENFVQAAYRFEAEFAERIIKANEEIFFEPDASIHHLKEPTGGTRSFGIHLNTPRPGHAVGAYYYLLRSSNASKLRILQRPFREIRTKYHLRHPWWIPSKLVGEFVGFVWASFLALRGPRLIEHDII